MTASTSRILTCRRRSRIHPQNSELIQATKPKMTAAFKPKMEPQEKLSVLSENTSQWPTVKETRTPSIDSDCENRPSIFRERADVDDTEEDMFVLKRANPVYDSDDDEEEYCTPPKRQRTNQVLQWGEQVNFGSHGFSIRL
eukprot:scaffold961_cov122-Cylindrotheca_fusiformis.AAC.28